MKRAADSSIPIAQHVAAHREKLVRQKEQLPVLAATRERLRREAEGGSGRSAMRRTTDAAACLAKLDVQIKRLESDEHIREFERQVTPYMEAYVKHSGVPKRKVSKFVVPGEPATRLVELDTKTQTQSDVVAEYLSVVQGGAPRPVIERAVDHCPRCDDTEMTLVPSKALLVCPKCGYSATFLDATSSAISYDENMEMVTFSYKRGNHFQDWLSNVQGLEAYKVPQEIVDAVMHELFKQRVTSLEEITTQRVRTILKSMKQRKCYDHVAQITSRITGRPPLRLPPEAVELMKLMFGALAAPFQRHAPANRKNFLSYSYILSKMLYIIGYDDLCDTLSLLKGQDKIAKMDVVWKKICAELDWPFYSSP